MHLMVRGIDSLRSWRSCWRAKAKFVSGEAARVWSGGSERHSTFQVKRDTEKEKNNLGRRVGKITEKNKGGARGRKDVKGRGRKMS